MTDQNTTARTWTLRGIKCQLTATQGEHIRSIFSGNRFKIPNYQRKYSWTDTETRALWQDIEENINNDIGHFIGTLSFKQNQVAGLETDILYDIIDGQQRMTTLFILLKALIDKLTELKLRDELLRVYIGNKENLKLQLPGDDDAFLKKLLFSSDPIDDREITKRSQKLLFSAKSRFAALVGSFQGKEIEERITFITNKIEVLVYSVENQAQAVKMFSIINDRGLPLRILDKTKSTLMLYSTLYLSEELNESINNGFEKIFDSCDDLLVYSKKLKILGRFEESTVFTHHYYSSRKLFLDEWNIRKSADGIFSDLKHRCENFKANHEELKHFIGEYLEDLTSFAIGYFGLVKEIEKEPTFCKPFRYLEFTAILYPFLVRAYMQGKLDKLLPILEAVELRVYKLRETKNPIADMYSLSSELSENDNLSVDDIKNKLIDFGERFAGNYTFRDYLGGQLYGNGGVKYILSEYSKNKADDNIDYQNFQVEHIFSQDPNYSPPEYGFGDDYSTEINRLGNLLFLEDFLNKEAGNAAPRDKVDYYLKSKNPEARELAGNIQKEQRDFNKSNIDERGKSIIDFCVERFPLSVG